LYVSYACPWAHRTLITRHLKGLTDLIDVTVVHWHLGDKGWRFSEPEPLYGKQYLSELYLKANPDYSARFTVPILWDKKTETIVNNESSEIIRFLNTEFNDLIEPKYKEVDIYQEKYRKQIDEINEWVYDGINNGVYKTGFATTQEAYDEAVYKLFECLDRVEKLLKESGGDYLLGKDFTEADLRLYPTIVRFDPVYVQHFKCNIDMIRTGYPLIHKWLRNLYWNNPAFKDTTNFEHIKFHYTKSHLKYNPYGITAAGPVPNIMPLDK
jgi:putative glutathione S-transferase